MLWRDILTNWENMNKHGLEYQPSQNNELKKE